jgi:16S rRNA (cytosine967-C5)-methyltransferase
VQLQWEILQNAARLVRPGGVLLYSTCTIEPEENEQQVERFLREHPEFTVEPATQWLSEVVCRDGMLQTLPHRHAHCDGAFAVRLHRQ